MKISAVAANNNRHVFVVETPVGEFSMPYTKVTPAPAAGDSVVAVHVDHELGDEGFTFRLRSGAEGSVHVDSVLEFNQEPEHMRELLLYRLTLEARDCVEASGLSKREIIRRVGTSPAQFYRLLDPANARKSVDGLLRLFAVLNCDVGFTVKRSTATAGEAASRASH